MSTGWAMEYDNGTNVPWEPAEYYYYSNFTPAWDFEEYKTWIVHNVLDGLATLLGLLANALLLALLARAPPLRTVSSMFLLQRAVADVLLLMVVPFIIYDRVYYYDEFAPALCTALSITMHGAMVASHVFLMLFTMDSYLVSCRQRFTLPLRRRIMRMTSGAAWLLATVFGVAVYFCYNYSLHEHCFFYTVFIALHVIDIAVHLVVPLVAVWVFVCMTLCSRPAEPSSEPDEEEGGPNRLLLLSLASTFTVMRVLFWFGVFLHYGYIYTDEVILVIPFTLPNFEKVLNPILVICLSEGLRQKVARWMSARHSASVPLQDL